MVLIELPALAVVSAVGVTIYNSGIDLKLYEGEYWNYNPRKWGVVQRALSLPSHTHTELPPDFVPDDSWVLWPNQEDSMESPRLPGYMPGVGNEYMVSGVTAL